MMMKVALLQVMLVVAQAIYMLISNTDQLKKKKHFFIAGLVPVLVFPLMFYKNSEYAYQLYLYSIVICMITAAIADGCVAAFKNREYLEDASARRLTYAYFMICVIVSAVAKQGVALTLGAAAVLAGVFIWECLVKNNHAAELAKAIPLAAVSIGCGWLSVATL